MKHNNIRIKKTATLTPVTQHDLYIVCALDAEARPLINHFKLKRLPQHSAWPVYQNPQGVRLIVSGMGKSHSAAACAYLFASTGGETGHGILLNIGLCGHAEHERGHLLMADKVIDYHSGQSWYPALVIRPQCGYTHLFSFEQPQTSYPAAGMIDMEASGFYSSAIRLTSAELAHCIKVVSDNKRQSSSDLNPALASELISRQMPSIIEIIQQLEKTQARLPTPWNRQVFDTLCAEHRCSVSQQHQLKRLLLRWQALGGAATVMDALAPCKSMQDLLRQLETELHQQSLGLSIN